MRDLSVLLLVCTPTFSVGYEYIADRVVLDAQLLLDLKHWDVVDGSQVDDSESLGM